MSEAQDTDRYAWSMSLGRWLSADELETIKRQVGRTLYIIPDPPRRGINGDGFCDESMAEAQRERDDMLEGQNYVEGLR